MSDEIIKELWQIKDRIAQKHEYDIEALVAYIQARIQLASAIFGLGFVSRFLRPHFIG